MKKSDLLKTKRHFKIRKKTSDSSKKILSIQTKKVCPNEKNQWMVEHMNIIFRRWLRFFPFELNSKNKSKDSKWKK